MKRAKHRRAAPAPVLSATRVLGKRVALLVAGMAAVTLLAALGLFLSLSALWALTGIVSGLL